MRFLPSPANLGELEIVKVFVETDEPCLFTAKNSGGELFLAVASGGDFEKEEWIFTPISPEDAKKLDCAAMDFYTAFRSPAGACLWKVTVDMEKGEAIARQFPAKEIPDSDLPKKGIVADDPLPVFDLPIRIGESRLPRVNKKVA